MWELGKVLVQFKYSFLEWYIYYYYFFLKKIYIDPVYYNFLGTYLKKKNGKGKN